MCDDNLKLMWVEPNSERWLNLEDLPNEIWKDIKDFEGLYQISNYGRVKRLSYYRDYIGKNQTCEFPVTYLVKEHILKVKKDNYNRVQLYKNSENNRLISVHILVAQMFIPNYDNKPVVDHINNNTYDNRVDNLQWVTSQENAIYSWQRGRKKKTGVEHKNSKKIGQYDLQENLLNVFYGSGEASRKTGVLASSIRKCCRGGYGCKTRGGYIWKYI